MSRCLTDLNGAGLAQDMIERERMLSPVPDTRRAFAAQAPELSRAGARDDGVGLLRHAVLEYSRALDTKLPAFPVTRPTTRSRPTKVDLSGPWYVDENTSEGDIRVQYTGDMRIVLKPVEGDAELSEPDRLLVQPTGAPRRSKGRCTIRA